MPLWPLLTAKAVGFTHWGLNPRVAGGSQGRRHVGRFRVSDRETRPPHLFYVVGL